MLNFRIGKTTLLYFTSESSLILLEMYKVAESARDKAGKDLIKEEL